MGRLTLIILVLFSVTAIYSEANAAAAPAADTGTTLQNLQTAPGEVRGARPRR